MKLYKAIRKTFWIDKRTNTQNHYYAYIQAENENEAKKIAHKVYGKDKILEIVECK
jgi:hypothetical protein